MGRVSIIFADDHRMVRDFLSRVSIIFADDHRMVRDFLRLAIQEDPGLCLICEAQDGLELMDQLKKFIPDVVILDISMPNMTGLQAAGEIKNLYPMVKIIMLTMHQNKHYVRRAFDIGVDAYVLKEDIVQINDIIMGVFQGKTYVSAYLADICRSSNGGTHYKN